MSKLFETSEAISIQDVFINYNPISIKENMKSDTCTEKEVAQELRTNIESEIDIKKSNDQMHQNIQLVEIEIYVNDLLQVQQQQVQQHQLIEINQ